MTINTARKIYLGFTLFCILTSSLRGLSQSSHNLPTFQLNHIDICIDSVSFNAILKNDFLRDSFAFVKVFTDSTGSEIMLLGKEFFIHLLPDKGFYENRLGATLLVHHSFQKQETKSLMEYLQSFTTDSLYNRPYTSKMNIDYINVYENLEKKDSLLKFIPILQNWSTNDYLSWGYVHQDLQNGITQKKFMADYVGKETESKLFKNVETITVAVTKSEKGKMSVLLNAYGYKRKGSTYFLTGNPTVHLTEIKNRLRAIIVNISLTKAMRKQNVILSDKVSLTLKNKKASLQYSIFENYH